MTIIQIIIISICCLFVGYILGFNYCHQQWLNCGYKNMLMRISKKYLFEVKYLGVDKE